MAKNMIGIVGREAEAIRDYKLLGLEQDADNQGKAIIVNEDNEFEATDKYNNHLSNTSNPHNVTPAQIGAAASGHTHTLSSLGAEKADGWIPNYASASQVSMGDYTPATNGYLRIHVNAYENGNYWGSDGSIVKVVHTSSGKLVAILGVNRYPGWSVILVPVKKGETYTLSGQYTNLAYFIPSR